MNWGEEARNLSEDISKANKETKGYVQELKEVTDDMISNWNKKRIHIKADLKSDFQAWDKVRKDETKKLRSQAQDLMNKFKEGSQIRAEDMNNLKSHVQQMTNEWSKERAQMRSDLFIELGENTKSIAKEAEKIKSSLRDFLKKYREGDLENIKKEQQNRSQEIDKFRKDVQSLMKKFRNIHKEAANAWKGLKKEQKNTQKNSGSSEKEMKIISIIEDNQKGITLSEIAFLMDVAPVSISKNIKMLMDDGHIRKEENKYFVK